MTLVEDILARFKIADRSQAELIYPKLGSKIHEILKTLTEIP
jgi:hypothetical protein